MQIICYPNRDKATEHKIGLKAVTIFALVISLEFLILGVSLGAAEKPTRIPADKLMTAYLNDEIAADAQYKGKLLAVTGNVATVGKDSGGTVYVTLETGVMVFKIQCFFKKEDDTAFAQIGSGVQVTIIGRCDGKLKEGNVLLKDCTLKGQLEKKQEAAVGYCDLGNSYHGLGDYQQAIKDFDRAIELDPKLAEAYWGRGKTYHGLGDYQQAIKDFDRAIELDPKLAEAYWDRGKTYNELGKYQQAIENWKRAAQLGNEGARDLLRSKEIKW
jgi:tetratricopeptide (TPR) repeat protein